MGKTDLSLTVYLYRDKAAFAQQLGTPRVETFGANTFIRTKSITESPLDLKRE